MAPNFEKITKESGVRNFGYYDMSSVMGYSTWVCTLIFKNTNSCDQSFISFLEYDVINYLS